MVEKTKKGVKKIDEAKKAKQNGESTDRTWVYAKERGNNS